MDHITVDNVPEENPVWDTASSFADTELHTYDFNGRPDHPYRELWYCPTATVWDAHRAEQLCEEYGIEQVYDLGAGDLRFSLWMADRGYDVTAYELNTDLAQAVADHVPLNDVLDDVTLRIRDYYADYDDLVAADAAVIAFGGTNKLPHPPAEGLGIQGYAETGHRVWHDGDTIAGW